MQPSPSMQRGANEQEQQQQQQQQFPADAAARCGSVCMPQLTLTSLQLVAVQPVVLRSHTEQQQQQQPQQQAVAEAAADLQHHQLLLQLQASVSSQHPLALPAQQQHAQQQQQPQQVQVAAITAGATLSTCHILPLPVRQAVLQVVLLNRQMQVLLHQQYGLQELLGASNSSSHAAHDDPADGQQQQEQEQLVNIQLSAPSQPSEHTLDALHLFVTLCSAQLEDPLAVGAGQPSQPACLVAELPLLVMPAAAQQEVQSLLLPAMRQDVQQEQQLQQLEQEDQEQLAGAAAADIAARALFVERAVWQHFNQLALDILLIMQLSEAVRAEAAAAAGAHGPAAGAASSAIASSQPLSQPSAASPQAAGAAAVAADDPTQQQQQDAAAVLNAATAMDNLLQAVNTLLLPLLLPFMTAHGLHNTLQVLLQCLPPQLQLQQHWQQQQLARLEALTALPPPPPPPAALPPAEAAPAAAAAAAAAVPAAALPSDGALAVVCSEAVLDTPPAPPPAGGGGGSIAPAGTDYASSESVYESGRSSLEQDWEGWGAAAAPEQEQQQQRCALDPSNSAAAAAAAAGAVASAAPGHREASDGGSMRRREAARHIAAGSSSGSAATGAGGQHSREGAAAASQGTAAGAGAAAAGGSRGDAPADDRQGQQRANSSSSSMGARGSATVSAATGMPCWLVPFKQFPQQEMERRYVAYKHVQLLYLDALGGVYQLAVAAALTKRGLLEHPATWVLLMLTLIKALPHVPLLLGLRHQHIRYRELWMFLASPIMGLILCCLVLFTHAWEPAAMPPMPVAYRSFRLMHGELITATIRAFFQHMRLTPFCIYTTVDRAVSFHLWAPWSGVLTAVGRSTLAGVVSVVACWALDLYMRRRFVLAGLYEPREPAPAPQRSRD